MKKIAQRLGLRKVGFQAAMGVNSREDKNLEAEMEPGYNRTKRSCGSGPAWPIVVWLLQQGVGNTELSTFTYNFSLE